MTKLSYGRPRRCQHSNTREGFDRLIATTEKHPGRRAESWKYLLRGLWFSGLRRAEPMRLHWTDDRYLTVDFNGKRPMFRIRAEGEKGNKDRTLPMAPEFAEMLMQTPEDEREGFVFNPMARKATTGRLSPVAVSRMISKLGKDAGVKVAEVGGKVKFASAHDLRRSFGFRWAMRIMPVVLQQLMRHESIQTTMEFYVGRNAETAADALWEAVANTSANTSASDAEVAPTDSPQTP